ncbi:hypothetical protein JRO89_XS05G0243300 [Xanthoceras sorbifolium]|uniref:Maturase K n=1 Tax=Xanthoceras sorbifolium TaxID=99658 RepID=A0ABQ8I352_9ROSI|nr:hypothetical protein JRO89_XS05G0243300 [Xanthoceras sorbifolium]
MDSPILHRVGYILSMRVGLSHAMDGIFEYILKSYKEVKGLSNDQLLSRFPLGRLGFKDEGLAYTHGRNETSNQTRPLHQLIHKYSFSYDLSSATDIFPLSFQETLVKRLNNTTVSFSWVVSGLGCNVFLVSTFEKSSPFFVWFRTGQPLGYLSSFPLFALSHHFVVGLAVDRVYPEIVFQKHALISNDIVIGDPKVAYVYREMMAKLWVKISLPKSLVSNQGSMEFAKHFCSWSRDLSPILAYSLRGILPLLFEIWLGFPEGSSQLHTISKWYAVTLFEDVLHSGAMSNRSQKTLSLGSQRIAHP